jgi:hypothetical protein
LTALNLGKYQIPDNPSIWYTVVNSTLGHKIVKHWAVLLIGGCAFTLVFIISGQPVTATTVFARILEAFGDVAFDRGIISE